MREIENRKYNNQRINENIERIEMRRKSQWDRKKNERLL